MAHQRTGSRASARWMLLTAALLTAAASTAGAQQRRGARAPSDEAPRAGDGAAAQIAPVPEEGYRVIELPGGYLRYQPDPGEESVTEGGLILVSGEEAEAQQADERPPTPEEEQAELERGLPSLPTMEPPCERERMLLAQRLLELRGVELDPASSLLVIEEAELDLGFTSHLRRSLFGLPYAGVGGAYLLTSASHDETVRERIRELAACLNP